MMYPPWLPWQEREFESHEPPLPRPPSDATHQEREAYVRTKVDRTKAKIKAEMSILELQCAYMDKAKTKKKLPPDVIAIATAEALDAIGSLHCSVETLKTQLAATKAKLKIAGLDVKNSPIVAQLKQDLNRETTLLKSARAAVKRWHLDPAVYKPLVPRNAADVAMFCETLPLAATDPHCVGLSINAFTVQRLLGYCVHVGKHTHAAAALEVYNRVRVTATAKMVPAIFQDLAGYGDVLEAAMSCPLEAKAVAQLTRLEGRVPQELNGKVLDMAAAAALVDPHPCNKRGRQRDHDVEYAVRQRMAATTGSIVIYDLVCAIVATALVPGTSPYVVPGGVKKLERMTFKTLTKYGADFSCCNDVVRCTVVTGSFAAMAVVVEAILGSEQRVVVVRAKNRFAPGYDANPSGGYLDFQMLVVFDDGSGKFQFGEIQVNLEAMVKIKERPGGGHAVFKYARSLAAFDPKTYSYSGSWSERACAQIENGVMLIVDMQNGGVGEGTRAALLGAALSARTCRVSVLK
jgi:hypothetical protein